MSAEDGQLAWDGERLKAPHAQRDKARRVRRMFDAIAPTYELVNRVVSAGRDSAWRRQAVELAGVTHEDKVLDVACGTGDFARAFAAAKLQPQTVVGTDFAERMLALAHPRNTVRWCRSDALLLPFADESFTVVSCAFGVRNFQDLAEGFAEMHRVLEPGGRAVILEFTLPRNRFLRRAYLLYFTRLLPVAASLISRDRTGAYRYLPSSVVSFADTDELVRVARQAGFAKVTVHTQTLGVAAVYVAEKPGNG